MKRLGAIFAGGQSRRFGVDKAAVLIDGIALIDHVAAALRPQCETLVIVGRAWRDLPSVDDVPRAGLGPLGALAGALRHAEAAGFDDVLTAGCDLPQLAANLAAILEPAPAVIKGQPLLGLWPCALAEPLIVHLRDQDDRSMRGWIAAAGARQVPVASQIPNINTPADLATFLADRPAGGHSLG